MALQLTKKIMDFIEEIYRNEGKITKDKSSAFNFYFLIWHLRDNKLIVSDGVNSRNQKVWKLTDMGLKIAQHIAEIKKIIREVNEGKSDFEGS